MNNFPQVQNQQVLPQKLQQQHPWFQYYMQPQYQPFQQYYCQPNPYMPQFQQPQQEYLRYQNNPNYQLLLPKTKPEINSQINNQDIIKIDSDENDDQMFCQQSQYTFKKKNYNQMKIQQIRNTAYPQYPVQDQQQQSTINFQPKFEQSEQLLTKKKENQQKPKMQKINTAGETKKSVNILDIDQLEKKGLIYDPDIKDNEKQKFSAQRGSYQCKKIKKLRNSGELKSENQKKFKKSSRIDSSEEFQQKGKYKIKKQIKKDVIQPKKRGRKRKIPILSTQEEKSCNNIQFI